MAVSRPEPQPIVAACMGGLTRPQPPWLEPPFHMTEHLTALDRARIQRKREVKLHLLEMYLMSGDEEMTFA